MTLEDRVAEILQPLDGTVVVGCSGGGDSVALLHLATRVLGPDRVQAITVDHGLRDAATQETALVKDHCAQLGVDHDVKTWAWDGRGNLQAAARDARRAFLTAPGLPVLLGHTADDQAETILLRLARGSGVDGLAGMRAVAPPIYRPLLGETRAGLRDWLQFQNLRWADDPSNEDRRFDRVRARQMAATLADLGLTQDRLINTAALMAEESAVLRFATAQWAQAFVLEDTGDLLTDAEALRTAPRALATRVLAAAIRWFSGASYKPRRIALKTWLGTMLQEAAPLGGVLATPEGAKVRLSREFAAISAAQAPGMIWDNRWRLDPVLDPRATVGALGADLAQCRNWRDTGLPRASVQASPALRLEGALIAAPLAGWPNGWQARIATPFHCFLESH